MSDPEPIEVLAARLADAERTIAVLQARIGAGDNTWRRLRDARRAMADIPRAPR